MGILSVRRRKKGKQRANKGQTKGKQRANKGQHRNNVNNVNNVKQMR